MLEQRIKSPRPNKFVTVKGKVVYSPTGRRDVPLMVDITCEVTKRFIWEGASLKEVQHGNFFIDKSGDGTPILNENGNRGISLSRFITEGRGAKPKDLNPLNVTLANWSC